MSADRVSRSGYLLGTAGLLPAFGALVLVIAGEADAALVGLAYVLAILSFLGGIWWGFAMRRAPERQWPLLVAAVVPSLISVAILVATMWVARWDWPLVIAGGAVLLTLPVDRALVVAGDAPADWMRLRVPLSLGLGAAAIVMGVLAAQ